MYGLINQGLHDLAVQAGGEDLWREIKLAAGVGIEAFVGMDTYPDDVTYRLVDATSVAMGISSAEVLHAFGKHWILYTARRGYGAIFETMGKNLPEFLANLDMMHARLSLSMPDMRPPSFVCKQVRDDQICLEYWSERAGLAPMVAGLLEGLGEMYGVAISVDQTVDRARGADHDEFVIDFIAAQTTTHRESVASVASDA
jgi:heme-NO-binding protein